MYTLRNFFEVLMSLRGRWSCWFGAMILCGSSLRAARGQTSQSHPIVQHQHMSNDKIFDMVDDEFFECFPSIKINCLFKPPK